MALISVGGIAKTLRIRYPDRYRGIWGKLLVASARVGLIGKFTISGARAELGVVLLGLTATFGLAPLLRRPAGRGSIISDTAAMTVPFDFEKECYEYTIAGTARAQIFVANAFSIPFDCSALLTNEPRPPQVRNPFRTVCNGAASSNLCYARTFDGNFDIQFYLCEFPINSRNFRKNAWNKHAHGSSEFMPN